MRRPIILVLAIVMALPAYAEGFKQIQSRDTFVSLIEGRNLTRLGIRLEVTPDGRIAGNAFGKDVTGAWQWRGGYFCRDLYWGERDLGPNCQAVKLQGNTMRFVSDRGAGEFADLVLR